MKLLTYSLVALCLFWLTSGSAWGQTFSTQEKELLDLINQKRQEAGLTPLTENAQLTQAARQHATNQAKQLKLAYTLNGQGPKERAQAAGYAGLFTGENGAEGFSTASAVLNAWWKSAAHKNKIMDSKANEVGIGVVKAGNGRFYWTQVFGKGNLFTQVSMSSEIQEPVTEPLPFFIPLKAENPSFLADSDSLDSVQKKSHRKVFVGRLEGGTKYVFSLDSNQFDSFLRIEDSNGIQVAFADNGGFGLNSRLSFTPKTTGTYRVIATSARASSTGWFLLTYSVQEQKGNTLVTKK